MEVDHFLKRWEELFWKSKTILDHRFMTRPLCSAKPVTCERDWSSVFSPTTELRTKWTKNCNWKHWLHQNLGKTSQRTSGWSYMFWCGHIGMGFNDVSYNKSFEPRIELILEPWVGCWTFSCSSTQETSFWRQGGSKWGLLVVAFKSCQLCTAQRVRLQRNFCVSWQIFCWRWVSCSRNPIGASLKIERPRNIILYQLWYTNVLIICYIYIYIYICYDFQA